MTINRYLVLIIIFYCHICVAQHSAVFEKNIYAQQDDTLPYRILYPQEYDNNTLYPLIVFLHGSGERGNDNEAPLKKLPEVFLDKYNRETFPCFILIPQCPKGDAWVNFPDFPKSIKATDTPTTSGRLVLSLISDLSSHLNVDTRRIYLTGYSMGGEGTFDLISRRPELFAAAVPICPVADTATADLIKDNNIWVFHGADDKVNEVGYSRLMIDVLRWKGGNPEYTEYLGVGHQSWVKAYKELDLIPWMFSHIKTNHAPTDNKQVITRQDTMLGSITPERKWWDVLHYDLEIVPQFETRTMSGKNNILYKVIDTNTNIMQIDLQQPLLIDSIILNKTIHISFKKEGHVWYLKMPHKPIGSEHTVAVYYSGTPHVAKLPPWEGGITWTRDRLNRPWITTSCQLTGASIWYPCKNHQSDEPDRGAIITITVPDTLVAVSNGKLIEKLVSENNRMAYKWEVINPINNYGLCFYVGKYVNITEPYTGIAGDLPLNFWVLDYNAEKAKQHLISNTKITIGHMEYWLGPYPFYEDGVKLVDAPYIGMEHQSAIAYGNRYKYGYKGKDISGTGWGMKYDIVLVHELAHEWFGNSITTEDLADKWIHEGLTGYAEILYLEREFGKQAANEYLIAKKKNIENKTPVIARYNINETSGADDFSKGRTIIHMVRQIIDDDKKFSQLMLNMNKHFYHKVTTSTEVEKFISETTDIDFSKLFDQYLCTVQIPVFEYSIENNSIKYRYNNCIQNFTMPLKVNINDKLLWLKPSTQWQETKLEEATKNNVLEVDPNFYVTMEKKDK